MKKLYTLTFLIASVASFAQIVEPFLGSAGTALNANGWTTHSGATPGQLTIAAGSLAYSTLPTSGNKVALVAANTEDVNLGLASSIAGTTYFSAVINYPNTDGLHPNSAAGDYFFCAGGAAGSSVTSLPARLYVKQGTVENTFNLGILNNSGGTATPTFAATDFPVNTPVFVVIKYDIEANTASLYINPAVGGTEGAATVTNNTGTSNAPAQIASVVIRQGGNATTNTGNAEIDLIRMADNWGYVVSGTLKTAQNDIEGLSIYPNPVTGGTLYINTSNNDTKSVQIFDVLGKRVVNATSTENSVNVSALNSGVYIVKVTEAGKTATRKLVIR